MLFWLIVALVAMPTFVGIAGARRRATRMTRLADALCQPALRNTAADEMEAMLRRERPLDVRQVGNYPALALWVARCMLGAGLTRRARRVLDDLPDSWLSAPAAVDRAVVLAACNVYLGEIDAARDALDELHDSGRHLEDIQQEAVNAIEAHVYVRDGMPGEALSLIGDRELPGAADYLALTRHVARAHAFAALDDTERANAAIDDVVDVAGDEGLAAVIEPEGPASRLARARSQASPYR